MDKGRKIAALNGEALKKRKEANILYLFWYKRLLPVLLLWVVMAFANAQVSTGFYSEESILDTNLLYRQHSLQLPAWGPYSKKYNGVSHISSPGVRFDWSVHFAPHRRRGGRAANTMLESGYHAWEAGADLRYYSYRYQLEWKDRVYADVACYALGKDTTVMRIEAVNNSPHIQDWVVHGMANINFPPLQPYSQKPLRPAVLQLPPGAVFVDDMQYEQLEYAGSWPQRHLVYDGQRPGELRQDSVLQGTLLAAPALGRFAGDRATYACTLPSPLAGAALMIRVGAHPQAATWQLSGILDTTLNIAATDTACWLVLPLGSMPAGNHRWHLITLSPAEVPLDGWVICALADTAKLQLHYPKPRFAPLNATWQANQQLLQLQYQQVPGWYRIQALGPAHIHVRQLHMDAIDQWLANDLNKFDGSFYNQQEVHGSGNEHFTNLIMQPLVLQPGQRLIWYCIISHGRDAYDNTAADTAGLRRYLEQAYRNARKLAQPALAYNPAGQSYQLSQQLMRAVVSTNVVYPVYTGGQYILHNTPGKIWDCLYTWDSGLIGIGLSAFSKKRAWECLNAYLMSPQESSAFLHHGTPLPTQAFLFQELLHNNSDTALLHYLYPRMRRYYRFLAGKSEGSTMQHASGLLRTWDYFYNSGGWDDYPAQAWVHANRLEASTAPVVNTAYTIRFAKQLWLAANQLGLKADMQEYLADVEHWANALQQHSWDSTSGYFNYVQMHQGKTRWLQDKAGCSLNMGLDGLTPLVAGIVSGRQKERMLQNMFTPGRIWSNQGLSTVDQQAPYYSDLGYWNGTVWMPHQWMFWKALLDVNEPVRALQVAQTALQVWQREVERTYNCYELLPVNSGAGGGWHQFGGLSAPVLHWYQAMFAPGTLTTGFDAQIDNIQPTANHAGCTAALRWVPAANATTRAVWWVSPQQVKKLKASWNGKPVPVTQLLPGLVSVSLPLEAGESQGKLRIWAP